MLTNSLFKGAAVLLLVLGLAGCEIAAGAALGAGAGAIAADATGNDVEDGAAVGGLVGAGIGALN